MRKIYRKKLPIQKIMESIFRKLMYCLMLLEVSWIFFRCINVGADSFTRGLSIILISQIAIVVMTLSKQEKGSSDDKAT